MNLPDSHKSVQQITIHEPEDFASMHRAGRLAAETLDYITPFVVPGVSTGKLDDLCNEFILSHGSVSACLGYRGYPKATCISVNHVVCHGIPSEQKILQDGDIANIDITVIVDGWFGDTSRMFIVGKAGVKARKLISITYECLMRGIEVAKPGATLGDIGHVIQTYAEKNRFSVVRDFCGHGLGRVFHCPPNVMHFGKPGHGTVLREGMFLTIEPMINAGGYEVKVLADEWTAVTKDRSLSAQFEHSIGITATGCEIFTLSPAGLHQPPYD